MMTRSAWVGLGIGIVLLVAALVYFNLDQSPPAIPALEPPEPALTEPSQAASPEPAQADEAEVRHPVTPAVDPASLPPLESSDGSFGAALQEALAKTPVEVVLVPRELIRRLVLNIDSLDREPAPLWLRSVPRVPGLFQAQGADQTLAIARSNAARYQPLMQAVKAIDVARVAAVYLRYYPLFQRAWTSIRTEGPKEFNDRLVEIIDHLLDTPEVAEPIRLVRPKVLYLYADPELEQSSSGQKALLRLGGENVAVIKTKLSELRLAVAAGR